MSEFNYQPLFGASRSITPRVLSSKFGDGYEQRVADGINTQPQMWSLIFTDSAAIIDAIDSFLIGKGGVTKFTWTPQGGTEISVICRDWSKSIESPDVSSLQCSFEQVYG
jgi:phage-related protein